VSVDYRTFREALGRFASGVCVVTAVRDDNRRPVGVTISAFSSLSLDPPLVLFCIGKRSANLAAFLQARHFSINVLGAGQEAISEAFAAPLGDKFAGIAGSVGANGCFLIDGALVTLECRQFVVHEGGDHHIVVGVVEAVLPGTAAAPLLRFRGAYHWLDERR